jgi:predicted transcriptional regulator
MDFSQDEVFETCDRLIAGLLERAGVAGPPVDALEIAEEHLGIPVTLAEPEEDQRGRPRPRSRRPTDGIVITPHMSAEQRQAVAAQAIARDLLADLFRKLGIVPGSESKQVAAEFRGLLSSRLLVPSRFLRSALRESRYDLFALKRVFATASHESIALRMLDLDEPCVIAVVDDGVVATRRGNRVAVNRKLSAAEEQCLGEILARDLPSKVRTEGWTAHGWPIPDRPFRRVVLRSVPDDV